MNKGIVLLLLALIMLMVVAHVDKSQRRQIEHWCSQHGYAAPKIERAHFQTGPFLNMRGVSIFRVVAYNNVTLWFKFSWGMTVKRQDGDDQYTILE